MCLCACVRACVRACVCNIYNIYIYHFVSWQAYFWHKPQKSVILISTEVKHTDFSKKSRWVYYLWFWCRHPRPSLAAGPLRTVVRVVIPVDAVRVVSPWDCDVALVAPRLALVADARTAVDNADFRRRVGPTCARRVALTEGLDHGDDVSVARRLGGRVGAASRSGPGRRLRRSPSRRPRACLWRPRRGTASANWRLMLP